MLTANSSTIAKKIKKAGELSAMALINQNRIIHIRRPLKSNTVQ